VQALSAPPVYHQEDKAGNVLDTLTYKQQEKSRAFQSKKPREMPVAGVEPARPRGHEILSVEFSFGNIKKYPKEETEFPIVRKTNLWQSHLVYQ
jgi:hypothetical protein